MPNKLPASSISIILNHEYCDENMVNYQNNDNQLNNDCQDDEHQDDDCQDNNCQDDDCQDDDSSDVYESICGDENCSACKGYKSSDKYKQNDIFTRYHNNIIIPLNIVIL